MSIGLLSAANFQYSDGPHRIMRGMTDQDDPHTLHIVGHFDDPHTGAERSLPDLAAALRGRRICRLWSDIAPHPVFAALGVRAIDLSTGAIPRGGSLLVGGVHVQLGPWLEQAGLRHVTLRYNLPNHLRLFDAITRIREGTGRDPDLVFVSRAMQLSVGLPGRVEPSLIRIEAFLDIAVERPERPVTVGRLSRDVIEKHDPQDLAVYRALAARGMRVRVMGGTCLGKWLDGVAGIELLPVGGQDPVSFLASLDIFFYRTGTFIEPYGRVVMEAMASALPVVAAANGGFAEQIRHGVDGFLVQTQEQALQALAVLAANRSVREQAGRSAREACVALHGTAAFERQVENYLEPYGLI